jgi:hypothetical protein
MSFARCENWFAQSSGDLLAQANRSVYTKHQRDQRPGESSAQRDARLTDWYETTVGEDDGSRKTAG